MVISRHDPNKVYPLDISEFARPEGRSRTDRQAASDAAIREENEQNVHRWLDSQHSEYPHWVELCRAMLAQPRLPEEPDAKTLKAMYAGFASTLDPDEDRAMRLTYRALRDHLTKPPAGKTKEVEVWHVEYATQHSAGDWDPNVYSYEDRGRAERVASELAKDAKPKRCIRVTGPHKQTVPAD